MKEEGRKKRNTAVFVLLATLLNVVLMIGFMILGFVLLGKFGNPDSNLNTLWLFLISVFVPSREMTISPFLISWLIFSSVRLLAKSRSSMARLMHFPLISGRFSRVAT